MQKRVGASAREVSRRSAQRITRIHFRHSLRHGSRTARCGTWPSRAWTRARDRLAAAQYADTTTTEDTATRITDGRFELLERLGSGGGGRARLASAGHGAAPEGGAQRGASARSSVRRGREQRRGGPAGARVVREARALTRLRHPHVVTVFRVTTGRQGGFPWLVTGWVPGGCRVDSLADRLDRSPLPPLRPRGWAGVRSRGWPPRTRRASRTTAPSRPTWRGARVAARSSRTSGSRR